MKDFNFNCKGTFLDTIKRCIDNDEEAIRIFSEHFGEDIYSFSYKVFKSDKEEAADFYCYCFEDGRIFRRFLTFKNNCSLKTYQYLILKHLFFEWKRVSNNRDIITVSFDDLADEYCGMDNDNSYMFYETNPSQKDVLINHESYRRIYKTLNSLSVEDRVYLKLLIITEINLQEEEIAYIKSISKKSNDTILRTLHEFEQRIFNLNKKNEDKITRLTIINTKILSLQKQIESLNGVSRLNNKKTDLKAKLDKVKIQKKKLIAQNGTKSSVSYRDIAGIFNISVGTVSKKIQKARELFREQYLEDI